MLQVMFESLVFNMSVPPAAMHYGHLLCLSVGGAPLTVCTSTAMTDVEAEAAAFVHINNRLPNVRQEYACNVHGQSPRR